MTEQLKPCPFCGGEAEYTDLSLFSDYDRHKIACLDCLAEIEDRTSGNVIVQWNTRHIPEGYVLVLIDDLNFIAGKAGAANIVANEYLKAMLKAAGDQDE